MLFDLFLIYGLAGVPKLGANVSAYSTVAVELIGLVWCIVESHRGDSIRPDMQGFTDVNRNLQHTQKPPHSFRNEEVVLFLIHISLPALQRLNPLTD